MQPTVIAHYAVARCLLLLTGWCLFLAFVFWSLLHPQTWTYPKGPGEVLFTQIFYLSIGAVLVLLIAVPLGFWLARGRSTMILLENGTLHFPGGWKIGLDELTDVRPGLWESGRYFNSMKIIELHKRDGSCSWIVTGALKEDRDMVVARLKDALARHRETS